MMNLKKVSISILVFLIGATVHLTAQTATIPILVRIPERAAALEKSAEGEERTLITYYRDIENKNIINAFKNYTFGPVYYFYDTDSKLLLDSICEGYFVNSETLKRDSNIKFNCRGGAKYVIAEFEQYFDEATQTSGAFGLVIYNKQFKVMSKPFPRFTTNLYGLYSYRNVITHFNKKVDKFLKKYSW